MKTHFVHISDTVANSVVHFSTAYSKIAWSVGPLCEHRQGDAFSIHLTAVLIMFCSRTIHALPVTFWLYKHS